MDSAFLGFLIAVFTAALPCMVLGYLIAYKNKHSLISGWDASKFSDPNAVGRAVGKSLIVMGVLIFIITGLWWKQYISDMYMTFALIPVVLVPIVASIYSGKKYGKHDI